MNQSEIEGKKCDWLQTREKACEQGMFGFGFAADWLRRWHVLCWLITERSKATPKQTWNNFRHSIENRSNSTIISNLRTWSWTSWHYLKLKNRCSTLMITLHLFAFVRPTVNAFKHPGKLACCIFDVGEGSRQVEMSFLQYFFNGWYGRLDFAII